MEGTLGSFFFAIFISSVCSVKTPRNEDYYHAAVVEYSPVKGTESKNSLLANAEEFTHIIARASEEADIVVFPEDGLGLFDPLEFIEVPFEKKVKDVHPVIKLLSEAARTNSIYVVANLHEKYISDSETLHYNTNIILDRNGKIIGRYRKTNLFGEHLNITRTPEHIYFDSDFGVRFGTFICFDILFKEPTLTIIEKYNVTDILFPTLWFSSLPFLTAVQTQAAWSYATDTNLLASGGNSVLSSNTGSGIYAGKKGPVIYLQSQRNTTSILFAKVFKKGKSGTPTGKIVTLKQEAREKLYIWDDPVIKTMKSSLITPKVSPVHEGKTAGEKPLVLPIDQDKNLNLVGDSGWKGMKTSLITPEVSTLNKLGATSSDGAFIDETQFMQSICHTEFCCTFNINATFTFRPKKDSSISEKPNSSNSYVYRIAAFNGTQLFNVRKVGIQFCALISCLNESLASCGKPLDYENPLVSPTSDKPHLYLESTVFHKISIKTSSLLSDNSFTFPNILEFSEDPNVFGSLMDVGKFSFSLSNRSAELNVSSSNKLLTAAVYTRVFTRDDPLPVPSFSFSFVPASIKALLIIVYIIHCTS